MTIRCGICHNNTREVGNWSKKPIFIPCADSSGALRSAVGFMFTIS